MTRMMRIGLPVLGLLAACGPSWMVVKQANPNPLVGQKAIGVDLVNFDTMRVGAPGTITEAEWVAKKKPEEQQKFQTDLAAAKTELKVNLPKISKNRNIAALLLLSAE